MDSVKKDGGSLARRTVKNVFFGGATGAISKVGALIFTILVARNFLPELFGIYSLALTIVISLFVLSDLGLGNTMSRYMAESIGEKNKKQARSRFWFLLKSKIVLSLAVGLLLFFGAGLISSFFNKPELILPLKIGSIYLFVSTFHNISTSVFLSFQKVEYSTTLEMIFQVTRIGLLFVVFSFFKSIESVFVILALSMIPVLIFSARIFIKKYSFLLKGKKEPVERKRMLRFSSFLALSSITIMIFSNIDKLILGFFLEAEFIGFYTAIFTVVAGVLGMIGITPIFIPVFTQLKGAKLKNTFKKSFHYISLVAFPASIGLSFVILPLLKILYGLEYVPPQYEFSLLLTSVFLSLIILEVSFSAIYRVLFDSKEKPKIPAMTNLFTSITNVVLNIVFIYYLIRINPSYGLIGASFATLVSRYTGMGILMFFSKKSLNITPNSDSIIKPLLASFAMLAYLFLFTKLVELTILTGILMILSAAAFYIILIFTLKATSIGELKVLIKQK